MNSKTKKILFIVLFCLDIAITIFLFVVSILMIATLPETKDAINDKTFIGFLQANPNTAFLFGVLIPLFLLLAVNIVVLILYMRKTNKKKKVGLDELSDDEKEALRRELMKDLAGGEEKAPQDKEE